MFPEEFKKFLKDLKILKFDNEEPQSLVGKRIDFVGESTKFYPGANGGNLVTKIYITATIIFLYAKSMQLEKKEIENTKIVIGLSFENKAETYERGIVVDMAKGNKRIFIEDRWYEVIDFRIYSKEI
jgi:hypothetical protein